MPDETPKLSTLTSEVAPIRSWSPRRPYDPIVGVGMTPQQLASLIQAANNGNHEAYLILAREMELRDPHYYSVLQTRKLSVAGKPRTVVSAADDTDAEATRRAEILAAVVNSRGFTTVLHGVLDAIAKGFSITEIVWRLHDGMLLPHRYLFRRPNWFVFDDETGEQLLLRESTGNVPLAPYKFIVHRPALVGGQSAGGGMARTVAAFHLFKSYALKNWMSFSERYGMPIRVGKYPPSADPQVKASLEDALQLMGVDAAAVIPEGVTIEFERAPATSDGGAFYRTLCDWLDKQTSKAVLGQTMTVEDGSSLAQANIHRDVQLDILTADAEQLRDTIQRDLIQVIYDLNWGPLPDESMYPQFEIDTEEAEDLGQFTAAALPWVKQGLTVEAQVIRDRFQLPEPAPGADTLGAAPAPVDPLPNDGPATAEDRAATAVLATRIGALVKSETNMKSLRAKVAKLLAGESF